MKDEILLGTIEIQMAMQQAVIDLIDEEYKGPEYHVIRDVAVAQIQALRALKNSLTEAEPEPKPSWVDRFVKRKKRF